MVLAQFSWRGVLFSMILLFAAAFAAFPQAGNYHLLNKYSFGATEGSTTEYFDYINVDSAARRVYLSRTRIRVR